MSLSSVSHLQTADSAAVIDPRNVRVGVVFIWLDSVGSAVVPDEERQGQHGLAGDEEEGAGFGGHVGSVAGCCVERKLLFAPNLPNRPTFSIDPLKCYVLCYIYRSFYVLY